MRRVGIWKRQLLQGQGRSTTPHIFHCHPTDIRNNRISSPECTTGTSPVVCPLIFISHRSSSLDLARNNLLSLWHQNSILPKLLRWCELSLLNNPYDTLSALPVWELNSYFWKVQPMGKNFKDRAAPWTKLKDYWVFSKLHPFSSDTGVHLTGDGMLIWLENQDCVTGVTASS